MKQRILVVADEVSLRASLARWLMAAGFAVELAESAKHAREAVAGGDLALAILAPERVDGAEALARELADAGRLVLVAGPADGCAENFKSPAVGSLSTPLREREVLARVEAILSAAATRKNAPEPEAAPECLRFDGYTLDVAGRSCRNATGAEVSLTRAEFSLLLALVRHSGRVLSRDELRQAMAGRDAEPDDRSVDVLISRLRRKIERDPKAPKMIVTVPGVGYKFGVKVAAAVENDVAPTPPAALVTAREPERGTALDGKPRDATPDDIGSQDNEPEDCTSSALRAEEGTEGASEGGAAGSVAMAANSRAVAARTESSPVAATPSRVALIGAAAVMVVGFASLMFAFWHAGFATKSGPAASPRPRFDAAVIPLVSDVMRKELASYGERPDFKALAISAAARGWGLSFGARDEESAKTEALQRCGAKSNPMVCRIYAVGMDVVWSPAALALPVPADVHTEPLDIALAVADIPTMSDKTRQGVVEKYVNHVGHKALAIKRDGFYFNTANSPVTARRLAVERCVDVHQVPCLLLSVDGMLTVQIPRSRPITDIFLLTTESEMSELDKERVGQVYREKEWRALARGGSGRWYPVANAASEIDAVEAALGACVERDQECRLHAIGNFRVAADK
jgi:DNA-binding response OmpR family regulator